MNYLVTGAAGFIGAAVAKRLLAGGHSVVTIDNLSTGKIENIPAGIKFIEGNVYDQSIINQISDIEYDAIIHIAGQSSGEVSFEDPEYDLKTNTLSTLLLLELAKKKKVKRFIFTSSMAVYGDQKNEFVTEETVPCPKSFYSVGKLASENYMRIFSKYGIQCTALRLFNVYGVGQNMDNLKQGMASIYLAQAITKKNIEVKGAGNRFRDFVYIDDVVDAVLLMLERNGLDFEIYNVSNARKVYVSDIIDYIEAKLPYPVTHEYIEGTPGDQHGVYGNNSKIVRECDWKPKYSFEEGMDLMIRWAIKL